MGSIPLTVGQAVVRFLAEQRSERDGSEHQLVQGCFGIFGHGNVAGLGQALHEFDIASMGRLPYHQARNEQAMVHTAIAFARSTNRLSTIACTSSIGPGATNMVTGAALATINRLPVLLLPGDVFATRPADPVLQQLEHRSDRDFSVNDTFRPVSVFFDRVQRPEQLPDALLGAMSALTDPAGTGAATVSICQDVQTECFDWPEALFRPRTWHIDRAVPDRTALIRAVEVLRGAARPLLVAGGGVIYSEATEALRLLVEATGIPVCETQAGKGSLPFDHEQSVGAVGVTGTPAANRLASSADVVIGVGTRWTDFTTASRSAFATPGVRFININVSRLDASKHAGVMVLGDARISMEQMTELLSGWSATDDYRREYRELARAWDHQVQHAYQLGQSPLPAQSEVIGAVNEAVGATGVVVCAAGSMPGDLHKLWRARGPRDYHVEYGYSCMGYEIAGGIGVKMANPDRDVCVLVGDGSYLMMAQELVTAVQEHLDLIVVLVNNHGFASIGSLSEAVGSERFGTSYRYKAPGSGRLEGDFLPIDFVGNARSLGATAWHAGSVGELRELLASAKLEHGPVLIEIETDPYSATPSSESWWDVPVAESSHLEVTRRARRRYEQDKARQLPYL